ncbi:hypothetical protein CEXT_285721 [Caerostris extrusa]|uniref:Uncharacterized protein n=1 Tax=Caerostris extrusa TaxID=172846 RepID=A0AAV4UZR3_CAEEX|nr:hypothetical protein CEXT_285721 [Caerostris extrusa]
MLLLLLTCMNVGVLYEEGVKGGVEEENGFEFLVSQTRRLPAFSRMSQASMDRYSIETPMPKAIDETSQSEGTQGQTSNHSSPLGKDCLLTMG